MKFLILVLGLPLDFANRNSDKWCEQGGSITWTNNPNLTITLLKQYKDTNYIVQSQDYGSTQDQHNNGISVKTKTTTYFIFTPYTNNRGATWTAGGYIS